MMKFFIPPRLAQHVSHPHNNGEVFEKIAVRPAARSFLVTANFALTSRYICIYGYIYIYVLVSIAMYS